MPLAILIPLLILAVSIGAFVAIRIAMRRRQATINPCARCRAAGVGIDVVRRGDAQRS